MATEASAGAASAAFGIASDGLEALQVVLVTVAAVMIVKNEEPVLERFLGSVRPHTDALIAVDTGSTDGTTKILREWGAEVVEESWTDFATARSHALRYGSGRADWLLMLDADMTIEMHPHLREWLDTDPDPEVEAWQVELREQDIRYRLPLLTRASADLRYEGATHEALVCKGKQRPLLGLSVTHHVDGANRADKHERDLELLADGVMRDDPRSTYYSAQALRCLGKDQEAAVLYERRAAMSGTWEEERWHAQYMAARLQDSLDGLLEAHAARPWRPEPLEWAARLLRQKATHADVLFLESDPHERMGSCQS